MIDRAHRWKQNLWIILWIATTAWALWATWKWKELERNPRLQNITTGAAEVPAGKALEEVERSVFVRQLTEKLLQYDSTGFWPNQTAAAFLMSPALREQKLQEINERREKWAKKNFAQQMELMSLKRMDDGIYLMNGILDGREENERWHLSFQLEMRLNEQPRTLENPWGLEVEDLKLSTAPEIPALPPLNFQLALDVPGRILFPCLVENVERPKDLPVKIQLSSLNVSELQLTLLKPLNTPAALLVQCQNRSFPLMVAAAAGPADVFRVVQMSEGQDAILRSRKEQQRRNPYRRTMEEELGFVVEE